MPRMVVLTDAETAIGYRLAGVEVREATTEDAVKALEDLIEADEFALVAGVALLAVCVLIERAMRGRDLPVLLSVPSLGAAFAEGDDATRYMKELVRSAIGFDIKLD